MRHLRQPKGSSLCGQTCIAMLLGIDLDSSIKEFNSRGGTRTKQIIEILNKNGYKCADKLKVVRKNTTLPEICICKVRWGTNQSHWILKFKQELHDPELDNVVEWDDNYICKDKTGEFWISSYLKIETKIN